MNFKLRHGSATVHEIKRLIARELDAPLEELTQRWDHEWLSQLTIEDPRPQLLEYHRLTMIDTPAAKKPDDLYAARLFKELWPLWVYLDGDLLMRKNILEIGCGTGLLGKQLGFFAKQYVGIDYSRLALSIARLVSPKNCTYVHLSDVAAIAALQRSMDIMVGRFFFIHQNFTSAVFVLRLAAILLKEGGAVYADFYLPNPAVAQGITYPARSPLNASHPDSAFIYSIADIGELAGKTGFRVEKYTDRPDAQRRFVVLIKNG